MRADASELIERYIEEDPYKPGPANARLKDAGTAVWALVSYLERAVGGEVAQAALDYQVPIEAVQAARAYYQRHRQLIDARIALNAA